MLTSWELAKLNKERFKSSGHLPLRYPMSASDIGSNRRQSEPQLPMLFFGREPELQTKVYKAGSHLFCW